MNNQYCILKRNIPSLIDSPEDTKLGYLVEHLNDCETCDQAYKSALKRRRILEGWIPESKGSVEFNLLLRERIKIISKQVSDELDGTLLKKKFLTECFFDLLSIFKSKVLLFILSVLIFFIILIYY